MTVCIEARSQVGLLIAVALAAWNFLLLPLISADVTTYFVVL